MNVMLGLRIAFAGGRQSPARTALMARGRLPQTPEGDRILRITLSGPPP